MPWHWLPCREIIQPGVTTADLDAAAAEVIRKHGAKPAFLGVPGAYPYPATTTVSINDELVHGIPGKRRLEGRGYRLGRLRDDIRGLCRRLGVHDRRWRDLSRRRNG